MGGYQLSYEAFETFVTKQAILAKTEREKSKQKAEERNSFFARARAGGSAEVREDAVFELSKYLGVPEEELKRIWLEAEA